MVLALSEIWTPRPNEHNLNGYHTLIKKERLGDKVNKGGGVGFFTREDQEFNQLKVHSIDKTLEMISIELPTAKTVILNCYRAPSGQIHQFIKLLSETIAELKSNFKKHKVIVGGDFNIDLKKVYHQHTTILIDAMSNLNQIPIIHGATRETETSSTAIDHIFTNDSDIAGRIIATTFSDHLATAAILPQKFFGAKQTIRRRQTGKENIDLLKEKLKNINWGKELQTKDPCAKFYQIFSPLLNEACPIKVSKVDIHWTPIQTWMTKEILKARTKKFEALKNRRETKTPQSILDYATARNAYNKTIRQAKIKFLNKEIGENSKNGKKIWEIINDFVNRRKKKSLTIDSLATEQGKIMGKKEMAEQFNEYFSTIGSKLASSFNAMPDDLELPASKVTQMEFEKVTSSDIREIVNSMENKTSTGIDEVSNKLLKSLFPELLEPITILVNNLIETKMFPQEMKSAKVIPIFKKGNKQDRGYYRPISLLPTISKIMEKCIDNQIRSYMEKNEYWAPTQFGFRKHHETGHAVIKMISEIATAKEQRKETLAVFLDLKKAFDTVPHRRLIKKYLVMV